MNAIFYNPILSIMRKREEYINSNYNNAKEFSDKAEEFTNQHSAKIKETQDKCRHNIKNIVETAHSEANEKTHAAREQSRSEIQSRKSILEKDEESLKNTVKSTVVKDLAYSITSKFLGADAPVPDFKYDVVNKVMD